MRKEDITHLANLSRIAITDAEAETLASSITDILGYVQELESLSEEAPNEKTVGPLFNVFRKDENPHEPGIYTEDLLNLAPERKESYVVVKKILDKKS